MRLSRVVLAIAVGFLPATYTVAATVDADHSTFSTLNQVKPAVTIQDSNVNRILRTSDEFPKLEDGSSESLDSEERVSPKLLRSKSNFWDAWFKTTKLDEEMRLRVLAWREQARNNVIFKEMQNLGVTPESMKSSFGIAEKIKNLSPAKLEKDEHYLLWKHFSAFVEKRGS